MESCSLPLFLICEETLTRFQTDKWYLARAWLFSLQNIEDGKRKFGSRGGYGYPQEYRGSKTNTFLQGFCLYKPFESPKVRVVPPFDWSNLSQNASYTRGSREIISPLFLSPPISLGHLVNLHVGACVFEIEMEEVGGRGLEHAWKGRSRDRFHVGHHLDQCAPPSWSQSSEGALKTF